MDTIKDKILLPFLVLFALNLKAQNIYQGGGGNGFGNVVITESAISLPLIYGGGQGIGSQSQVIDEGIASGMALIYGGGGSAGNELVVVNENTPLDLFSIYTGGAALGYSSSTLMLDEGFELPIELSYFRGIKVEQIVRLEWSTLTELNNDFFTVERSTDQRNWEALKEVKGAGNSYQSLNYHFDDEKPLNGIAYYRLKQTDFDGQYSYSSIVIITNNLENERELVAYPNPFTDQLTLLLDEKYHSKLRVFSIDGKEISYDVTSSLSDQMTLKLVHGPKGIYILKSMEKSVIMVRK
ncbi:T9SS type A sorting domain-containing protein [Flammeovirga aprica]|uniref:T9SS type A sorting domain-containing protein n=1 Tax=Flammeovirga aprica JL-4 TaxID=694437 RepID=A0A7X9RU43_9BACT|nr:T9SS type A sorting domain-containing protein [Flammeovirga aprica]NME68734.1 T9SS type A sorting domain-containing protein [Flammeovirga aprica JL-4]